jgi:hypothetical protein
VPESVRITVLADRGFGDQKLYAFLRELNLHYIIRFRSNITVTDKSGGSQPAESWFPRITALADWSVRASPQTSIASEPSS